MKRINIDLSGAVVNILLAAVMLAVMTGIHFLLFWLGEAWFQAKDIGFGISAIMMGCLALPIVMDDNTSLSNFLGMIAITGIYAGIVLGLGELFFYPWGIILSISAIEALRKNVLFAPILAFFLIYCLSLYFGMRLVGIEPGIYPYEIYFLSVVALGVVIHPSAYFY